MAHQVQVNRDYLNLPNGFSYRIGATPTLSDSEFARLASDIFTSGALTDLGIPISPLALTQAEADARYLQSNAGPGPSLNMTLQALPNYRKAMSGARVGARQGRILILGDSRTYGYGPSNPPGDQGWPADLSVMLGQRAPAAVGLAIPGVPAYAATNPDARFTLGSGWTVAYNPTEGLGWADSGLVLSASPGSGTLSFTPGTLCDTFTIWSITNTALGSLSVNIDGGADTVINTNVAIGLKKTVITGSASSAHVLNFHAVTGAIVFAPLAIEASLSTAPKMLVGNAGVSASTAVQWATNTGAFNGAGPLDIIKAVAPDLTIIDLGTNDASAATSVATYMVAMDAIIGAAQISGDVIPVASVPVNPAASPNGATYLPLYRSALIATGLPVYDAATRFGSYASANALGFYSADGLHLTLAGYSDYAAGLNAMLALAA